MGYVCDVWWHFSGEGKQSGSVEFTGCTWNLLISYSLCHLRLLKLLSSHQPLEKQPFFISQPVFLTILLSELLIPINEYPVIQLLKHSTFALPWTFKCNEADNSLKLDVRNRLDWLWPPWCWSTRPPPGGGGERQPRPAPAHLLPIPNWTISGPHLRTPSCQVVATPIFLESGESLSCTTFIVDYMFGTVGFDPSFSVHSPLVCLLPRLPVPWSVSRSPARRGRLWLSSPSRILVLVSDPPLERLLLFSSVWASLVVFFNKAPTVSSPVVFLHLSPAQLFRSIRVRAIYLLECSRHCFKL